MRFSFVVFSALVLGGCAVPARAEYLFDFQFGGGGFPGYANFPASEVVYEGTSFSATTLTYVSGSVDGYAPATISAETYDYEGKPGIPASLYSATGPLNGPAFAIGGFSLATYTLVDAVGDQPVVQAQLESEYPNNFLDPTQGYTLLPVYTDASLTVSEVVSTPEPGTWGLVGTGVLGLVGVGRRRFGR